jgi:hypothetical protein
MRYDMDCEECLGRGDKDHVVGHDVQRLCTAMVYGVSYNDIGQKVVGGRPKSKAEKQGVLGERKRAHGKRQLEENTTRAHARKRA